MPDNKNDKKPVVVAAETPQSNKQTKPDSIVSPSPSSAAPSSGGGPRKAMSGAAVAKDEQRKKKILVRVISGALMIAFFLACVYMGHLYICGLVAFIEFLLFRELVRVRYNAHYLTIQDTIPLFRTTQWMWFCVAIFYTYSDFVEDTMRANQDLHPLLIFTRFLTPLAFGLYSATFVLTIATMQVGHIKFQLNQLCWTIVVLMLTVGQLKYIMHNIFNGLFWFAFPVLLVVTNDIMAYVSGMTCGRKFIQKQFISFSPNKTWEGFIGGGVFTLIVAWYLSRFMAQFTWMTCPTNEFRLFPTKLTCELDPIFQQAQSIVPSQVFELFPRPFVKMLGLVEICTSSNTASKSAPLLVPCVSGDTSQSHHHFEFILKHVYPVQIHALGLALFASFVAPFGGFLASAIKRAYGIKDFDSIIPGHGGVMDRMDCQFLMALCTWVHYNTFVRMTTVSVAKLVYYYNLLPEAEQSEFLKAIGS